MGNTTNFGLSTLVNGDSFDKDGYKYTSADRHLIDRLLGQLIDHHHNGEDAEGESVGGPPQLELSTTGGNLRAGLRIYYRIALVDVHGNDTSASPVAYIDTPNPVSEPSVATLSTASTGGSLPSGTYNYVLTAYTTSNTLETKMGTGIAYKTVNSGTSTNTITLTMPSLPTGATGFNIYRKGPGNPRFYYLASTSSPTYTDTGGTALTSTRTTPNRNTTFSTNKVTISYPGATPLVPEGYTWRIYRSFDQSDWAFSVLHHVVEEYPEESDIIDVDFDDVGQATSIGSPSEIDIVINNPEKVLLSDAAEVQGYLPSGLMIVPVTIQMSALGIPEEGDETVPWVCEYDEAKIIHARACLSRDSIAVDDIVFDVEAYDADAETWDSIFDSSLPTITAGEWIGEITDDILNPDLTVGQALVASVFTSNEDVATPTAYDWNVSLLLMVKHGSETESFAWS